LPNHDAGAADTTDVAVAVAALARGAIVAFPTETFYGLAVDATNADAIERLYALKGRGAEKALSLIATPAMVADLVASVPAAAARLMTAHWPGPLTLVLPARPGLPAALVDDGCVAVRESPQPLARALVAGLGRPITATSANRSGQPATRTPVEVRATFPTGCWLLDGGETPGGRPSTLVRLRGPGDAYEVLRPGVIPTEVIAATILG
jgi:L-threonylcarbamoyladenylate synthase